MMIGFGNIFLTNIEIGEMVMFSRNVFEMRSLSKD